MSPLMLLLVGGGLLMLGSRKRKALPPPEDQNGEPPVDERPAECPVGFYWDEAQRMCVPAGEGPPQIHVTGLCEWWQILPNPQAWLDQFAAEALRQLAEAIKAEPSEQWPPAHLYGQDETLTPDVITHLILSNSPIPYAAEEFPNLGLLCKLPLSAELGPDPDPQGPVPQAMVELHNYVQPLVADAVQAFNQTGQFTFPEVSG